MMMIIITIIIIIYVITGLKSFKDDAHLIKSGNLVLREGVTTLNNP